MRRSSVQKFISKEENTSISSEQYNFVLLLFSITVDELQDDGRKGELFMGGIVKTSLSCTWTKDTRSSTP